MSNCKKKRHCKNDDHESGAPLETRAGFEGEQGKGTTAKKGWDSVHVSGREYLEHIIKKQLAESSSLA